MAVKINYVKTDYKWGAYRGAENVGDLGWGIFVGGPRAWITHQLQYLPV